MSSRQNILFLLLLFPMWLMAQGMVTTVVGEVYDAETGLPMPNVNVYLQGTKIGTTTTPEGVFMLRTNLTHKATMVVSSVGYQKQRFEVQPGLSAGIDVVLTPKSVALGDVLVAPGLNPALAIMKQVRAHRKENDLEMPTTQQKDLQVYLSNIQAKHLKRHIWQTLQAGMLQAEDSSYLVPLYRQQQNGAEQREQTSLLTATDWQQLLADFDASPDFYHNTIPFYSATLISPLAGDGNTYYQYYLIDSVSEGGKAYRIDFRTKNAYYPTFNGYMLIDSASYSLREMDAEVPREVNLNYLHHLHIRQKFSPVREDTLVRYLKAEEKTSLTLDFAVKQDTTHIFPSVLIMQSRAMDVREESGDSVHIVNSPTLQDSASLLSADSLFDAAANSKLFRWASLAAYVIQNGYFPAGKYVEIGKLTELIRINRYETVRLGFPLRTTENLSKMVCLEAFAAYGFGDKAWKGAGMIHLNLPTQRRHILSLRYADEYMATDLTTFSRLYRENSAWYTGLNFTGHLTSHFYYGENKHYSEVRKREFRVYTEDDWTDHLETHFQVNVGKSGYGQPTSDYGSQPTFQYASLSATARIGFNEKKVDFYFHRVHVYNHLPVLYFNAEIGSTHLTDADNYDLYGWLRLMVRQQVPLGIAGQLDYLVEGGVLLGRAPYTMMQLFAGNQSYCFDMYRFTLMHNGQYAADRYLLLQTEWNGRGCLFNLIPGIRYLRLRELASFKLAYGASSDRHLTPLEDSPLTPYSDLRIPYVEAGVGIGNILRIGDIYSVWRLTHRNDPGAPTWSMRFRFRIEP